MLFSISNSYEPILKPELLSNTQMDFHPVNVDEFDDDATALDLENPLPFDNYGHVDQPVSASGDPNPEPFEGMEFDSEQSARVFYNSYARCIGFSIRVSVYQRSRRDGSIICRQIVCSREGFRRAAGQNRSKRQRTVTRVGCRAQITVKKQSSGKWVVSKFVKDHNHELVPPDKVHCLRSHRHVSGPARSLIDTLQAAGMGPSGVMSVLIKESGGINNVGFTKVDCQNYMSSSRQRTLGSGGRHPISITTDQDRIIGAAVAQVFPETRHRFCRWNVFREAQEKLSDVYHSHPTFEAEFQRCINLTETVDEFESCWEFLLLQYGLGDNEWLQSMYNTRKHWVPVYLRDTFFGEMSTITQGSDGMNSYFDGYINASTNAQGLIKQYEKAVASRYEKEVKADYDTLNASPTLKTPSPMEKQAVNLYTKKIFMKFQEELVETLVYPATAIDDTGLEVSYRVAKFREDHKAHFVKFDTFRKKASCSCQMFEYSGIICKHVLAVFRVTNVLTLPSPYILKRWTRNAKNGVTVDGCNVEITGNSLESYAARYDNLCHEAIKFMEVGTESMHAFNIAMDALHEAASKVACSIIKKFPSNPGQQNQSGSKDQEKKIEELNTEVEYASQRCEGYRAKLMAVLKDMEEQKLKLSVKVQNLRLTLKD
ncbi:hypothetical protein V6N13_082798 [Hibiscus sabdariffa]|uniref:Protein FAR1-RELATED SEQUENCE n=1 Tax=Hibiscus sabdariffa TaxID=183260 RepID=A0ABR2C083_9ROSI